ncbi:MAG TPA: response regulator transcription factor, partial [Gaiellaceae bacterium]
MGVDELTLTLADESAVANLADYQLQRRTKVLLCDGQALMLLGVRQVLEQADGFDVVGEARVGSEVLPLIGRTNPDVVLLDMRMPGIDGLGCLDRIRLRHPNVKVVIFSVSTNTEHIQAALARGASGY